MKEGWTYKKLGEVFKTYAGGTPSKTNKANYDNGTIPWIRSGEVCRKYITESELFISEEGLKNSSAKYYPINTVLVAMYGATAAQSGILRFEATSNQAVCGILPHKDFLPEFVYAFFTYIKDELASQAQGGAQPNISQEKIKKILFPCIPLSEQQRIVSRLDSAFAHIDELKANAEKQLSEARTLFQKALTKAMEPKEGWEECQIGEICTLSQGLAINAHTKHLLIQSSNLPLLRIKDMKDGTREIFVDEKNCPQGCIANEDEIIYTRTGTLGLVFTGMHGVLHNNCFKIMHDAKKIDKNYLIYFLQHDEFKQTIIGLASRAAQPDITHKLFKAQMIQFPPLSEQQRIASRLDSLSAHVRELEEVTQKTIAECDALKQALLRKVFE